MYDGEKFQLEFKFGSRYPFESPEVKFIYFILKGKKQQHKCWLHVINSQFEIAVIKIDRTYIDLLCMFSKEMEVGTEALCEADTKLVSPHSHFMMIN